MADKKAIVDGVVERLRSGYREHGYDCTYPPGEIFVCTRCEAGAIAPNVIGDDSPAVIVGNACPDCAGPSEEISEWTAWKAVSEGETFSLHRAVLKGNV